MARSSPHAACAAALGLVLPLLACGQAQPAPTWTPAGSMSIGRGFASAVLIESGPRAGQVLAIGGVTACLRRSCALSTDEVDTPLTELFDPAAGRWTATSQHMIEGRSRADAVFIPDAAGCPDCGKVLVAGGFSGLAGPLDGAELYDPGADTWTRTQLARKRAWPAVEVLGSGQVLVSGGVNWEGFPGTAEVFDPRTGAWSETAPMREDRWLHTATRLGSGKVLVAGGRLRLLRVSGANTQSAELYDPSDGSWSSTGSMLFARSGHQAVLLPSGKVLVVCGGGYREVEIYDPASGGWTQVQSMSRKRDLCSAARLPSGRVLVVEDASAEIYDPVADTWQPAGQMSVDRQSRPMMKTLLSGRVLVAGGGDGGNNSTSVFLDSAEVFSLE